MEQILTEGKHFGVIRVQGYGRVEGEIIGGWTSGQDVGRSISVDTEVPRVMAGGTLQSDREPEPASPRKDWT